MGEGGWGRVNKTAPTHEIHVYNFWLYTVYMYTVEGVASLLGDEMLVH